MNTELKKLEAEVLDLENKIEEDENYIYENEFEIESSAILNNYDELKDRIYFPESGLTEKIEMEVRFQLISLKKIKAKIDAIQEICGNIDAEGMDDMMNPNRDED